MQDWTYQQHVAETDNAGVETRQNLARVDNMQECNL